MSTPEEIAVIDAILEARDLRGVMNIIRHSARELINADGVTVVLREAGYCHYAEEDAIGPLWKGRRFPLDTCISGWVKQHGVPAVIPDIFVDPRIPVDAYRPTFVKSLAMVPVGTALLAAIGAYWARPYTPTDGQIRQLQALAAAAAVVIEQTCHRCHLRGHVRVEQESAEADAPRRLRCDACDHTWEHPVG